VSSASSWIIGPRVSRLPWSVEAKGVEGKALGKARKGHGVFKGGYLICTGKAKKHYISQALVVMYSRMGQCIIGVRALDRNPSHALEVRAATW